MARGKCKYNKDSERGRQREASFNKKYPGMTTFKLKEKVNGPEERVNFANEYIERYETFHKGVLENYIKKNIYKKHGYSYMIKKAKLEEEEGVDEKYIMCPCGKHKVIAGYKW